MRKQEVLDTLENFPDEFKLEEFVKKLLLNDKIKEAQKDIEEGKVYSLEDTRKFFQNKWSR